MKRALLPILGICFLLVGCATNRPAVIPRPSAAGGNPNLLDSLSPKLARFLAERPAARDTLTNACSEAFSGKEIRLYYFYSGTNDVAPAFHFYRGENMVNMVVRENQEPWDEYIGILYETLNSLNEEQFNRLASDAERGKISRDEFPMQVLKLEHSTIKRTRELLKDLKLSESEQSRSVFYRQFLDCPDDFEGFLAYISKQKRNPIREYQRLYEQNMR